MIRGIVRESFYFSASAGTKGKNAAEEGRAILCKYVHRKETATREAKIMTDPSTTHERHPHCGCHCIQAEAEQSCRIIVRDFWLRKTNRTICCRSFGVLASKNKSYPFHGRPAQKNNSYSCCSTRCALTEWFCCSRVCSSKKDERSVRNEFICGKTVQFWND